MSFHLVTALMIFVILETLITIVVWATRSPWWKYQAGRSLMALLAAQLGILTLAIMSRLFGYDFSHRDLLYSGFYLVLAMAMAWVGATIVKAQNNDRKVG